MAMPSRKRLVLWILLTFLIVFFGGIILYLAPLLFGETTYDAQGNPTREVNLFPFGANTDTGSPIDIIVQEPVATGGNGVQTPNTRGNNEKRQDQLRQIDEGPVIGAFMFNGPRHSGLVGPVTATTTDRDVENTFRYVELGTGHVFEGSTNNGEITRISNTTIPRIAEARFVNKDRIIMRYADATDRIKTFSAELVRNFADNSGTDFKLQGIFLQDNIFDLDSSPSGKLLQVQEKISGVDRSAIVVSDELGGSPVQAFASPVTEWLGSWNGQDRTVLLQNKPSYNSVSTAYTLDTQTGTFTPYIAGRKGLSVLTTNDLSNALLSVNENGATKLYSWNRENNQYIDLDLSTFAEKCVYAPVRNKFYCAVPLESIAEAEPDLWYQGVTKYTDQIWEIDPVTGQSTLRLLPIQFTQDKLDMIDFSISADEQYIYFRDKTKRSLWSYQIDYEATNQVQVQIVESTTATNTVENLPEEEQEDDNVFFDQ